MATKTIAWTSGSGNITLTYTGQGNGSISVASDANDSVYDREQSFNIVTTEGSPEQALSILVKQAGKTYDAGTAFDFGYTGSVQEITLPKGRYKLQCWGAQGGSVTGTYAIAGSKGGYSEGEITLTETTTFYVFVGGQGTSYTSSASQTSTTVVNGGWNGGGAGVRTALYSSGDTDGRSFPRGGGGATDISTVTSALSYSSGRTTRDSASLLARCIVAGGGAGASAMYTITTTTETVETLHSSGSVPYSWYTTIYVYRTPVLTLNPSTTYRLVAGGSGGSLYRYYVQIYNSDGSTGSTIAIYSGLFTTTTDSSVTYRIFYTDQTTDSASYTYELYEQGSTTTTSTSNGKSSGSQQGGGTSGKGQYPGTQSSYGTGGAFGLGASQSSTNYRYCAGGGGGGWYGGGTGKSDSSTSYINYSGGGSGFVNTAANASYRPDGYTGLELDSGTTTAGDSSFKSTSGGTETGHSGNGYARITALAADGSGGSGESSNISVNLNSQWQASSVSNPDSSLYDIYESYSNYNVNSGVATMYITITGLTEFTCYIRSYAESSYDYVSISQLDQTITGSSSSEYSDTTLVKAYTRGNQQSGTALSNYTEVNYTGIDGGTHVITVIYRKDSSDNYNDDKGYILVPKSSGSSISVSWATQSGTWNSASNSSAADGVAYTCVSPGTSGSTVIRCTFSGVSSITFNCVYNGESNYDYLTVGSLDTACTRSSYGTTLKGTSGTAKDITFTCDTGEHYVEFCYSKDGSVDTSPDNATVYVKSYS